MLHHKDFIEIAEIISFIVRPIERKRTAVLFSCFLAKKNPRFDKDKFIKACGVEIK